MSWVKRRGHTTPNPPAAAPPVQLYDPNQHAAQSNQWQTTTPDYQAPTNWFNQTPQNQHESYAYNQAPQQQTGGTQHYWQQNYNQQVQNQPATNQYNQQPGFYNINNYGANEQQHHQQQQQQALTNSFSQDNTTADTWNWGWGDEDNSNVQAPLQPSGANSNTTSTLDSFSNDKTWEWSIGDNSLAAGDNTIEEVPPNEQLFPKVKLTTHLSAVRNENLTPQWSMESQMSQDSSDDIIDSKLSRSSTISQSPLSGHDANFDGGLKADGDFIEQNREILNNDKKAQNSASVVQTTAHAQNNERVTATPPKVLPPPPPQNKEGGSVNPYKQTAGFSHRAVNKFSGNNVEANLETLPDNSEQPDLPQKKPQARRVATQQWQENVEVAPINDRNQYLETGQLSDIDLNQSDGSSTNLQQETVDTLPPPGLRRMVLGQNERISGGGATSEEPPPGLSRMVLGQTENTTTTTVNEPPLGVRMIPGESSSPETTQYQPAVELATAQPRSATIGADTPPHVNRSETIGADETTVADVNRRQSIEGQPEDSEVTALTNTVRDLTVGENTTDGTTNSVERKTSRQESSDSERGDLSPRDRRSGRSRHEERGKQQQQQQGRSRYSPDSYKDKRGRYHRERPRYEEDTDYYSERERERRDREEYERKYGSLRKEKERRRRGGERQDGRRDYYYGRYDDEYENDTRPSSRSDSMHENYRERVNEHRYRQKDRDRERDYHRRQRDPHGYMQMYGYDPYNPYYQQYQYYENLRRTNPQAYAEWYRKYYQQAATGQPAVYGTEDRASVHSGRSSANDELAKDRYTRQSYYSQSSMPQTGGYYRESQSVSGHYGLDTSSYGRPFDQADSSLNLEDTTVASQRLTPAKFATAHIKISINSGIVVRVPPHYPLDGQSAAVDFGSLQAVLGANEEYTELVNFPGPLIRGVTHKKTIIEYCESKIRQAGGQNFKDCQSYVLMWELLILLIRQNGMVVGTDIAELLMKDSKHEISYRPPSVTSNASNEAELQDRNSTHNFDESVAASTPTLKEEFVTNKFREHLLHGSEKEALEWAMKHGLWGHALFLASKLDKRTYANVMMRFANGLTLNDPLQTLYQLLSGRIPAAVTCVADEKWGDWKPHLAMILSNTTQRPELDRKAITTLADTLYSRGSIYAAQFCYLMAQVDFGRYGQPDTKLALLGSNHTKSFRQFATNEAIFMTEIYEYACSLNESSFLISEFQPYKYLLATRMADMGLLEKSLAYLERLANVIVLNPTAVQTSLIDNVCKLADRLKFYDLTDERDDTANFATENYNRPDNSWLKDLIAVQQSYNLNTINQQNLNSLQPEIPVVEDSWQQQQQQQQQQQTHEYEQYQQQGAWQVQSQGDLMQATEQQPQNGFTAPSAYPSELQQGYWAGNQEASWNLQQNTLEQQYNSLQDTQQQGDYWNNTLKDAPPPQISMPNQPRGRDDGDDDDEAQTKKDSPVKPKPTAAAQQKQEKTSSTGWFGGIWSKLAPKPKNQMKLPDDKNPTIVWDSEKKRWTNLEEEGNEGSIEIKPPPKMSDLLQKMPSITPPGQIEQQSQPNSLMMNSQPKLGATPVAPSAQIVQPEPASLPPKPPSQQNMFKLQRSRNLKKSYVDVFNPGGKPASGPSSLPPPDTFSTMPTPGGAQMNFFIPQPVANHANAPTDFLTPAGATDAPQLSRWSSASSLSREVQSYVRHKPPPVPR